MISLVHAKEVTLRKVKHLFKHTKQKLSLLLILVSFIGYNYAEKYPVQCAGIGSGFSLVSCRIYNNSSDKLLAMFDIYKQFGIGVTAGAGYFYANGDVKQYIGKSFPVGWGGIIYSVVDFYKGDYHQSPGTIHMGGVTIGGGGGVVDFYSEFELETKPVKQANIKIDNPNSSLTQLINNRQVLVTDKKIQVDSKEYQLTSDIHNLKIDNPNQNKFMYYENITLEGKTARLNYELSLVDEDMKNKCMHAPVGRFEFGDVYQITCISHTKGSQDFNLYFSLVVLPINQ